MAGSMTNYLEDKVLDDLLNGTAYSKPTTLYFGLFTAAPTDAGGGTEVSGGSYARVSKTANTTNFPAASGGAIANGTAVTFPTASGSWGTVVAAGIFDASSGGNLLWWGDLAVNKAVTSGDTFSFPVGDVDITLD
jgi:hypothetical protein